MDSYSSTAETIFFDTSDIEASFRNMSAIRDKRAGVSSKAGWCEEKGGREIKPFYRCSHHQRCQRRCRPSRGYEHRLCVLEHDCDLDVALSPSWLQDITGKSGEESKSSLFEPCNCFPVWNLVAGEILDLERGQRVGERRIVGWRRRGLYEQGHVKR